MSSENCALDAHGNLLDASQITWFNDPDDATPLPTATPDPSPPVTPPPATTLAHFFRKSSAGPSAKVAGARRSNRPVHPSSKAKDPNNAMLHHSEPRGSRPLKRKRARRHVSDSEDESTHTTVETEPDLDDGTHSEGDAKPDDEAVDNAYNHTKGLAETDRVCHPLVVLFIRSLTQVQPRMCRRRRRNRLLIFVLSSSNRLGQILILEKRKKVIAAWFACELISI